MYEHDYYQISSLIILPLVYLNFLNLLIIRFPGIHDAIITKALLLTVFAMLIFNCRQQMKMRYGDFHYEWSKKNIAMYGELTPYLRNIGINRDDIVYCSPDPSINISLYLMDQKGFTDFILVRDTTRFEIRYHKMRENGLEYVIIGDTAEFAKVNDLRFNEIYLGEKIGQFGQTMIFKVK
jgi:hypothetical protein